MDDTLNKEELKPYLCELAGGEDEDAVTALFTEIDVDGDGEIGKGELFDFLKKKHTTFSYLASLFQNLHLVP